MGLASRIEWKSSPRTVQTCTVSFVRHPIQGAGALALHQIRLRNLQVIIDTTLAHAGAGSIYLRRIVDASAQLDFLFIAPCRSRGHSVLVLSSFGMVSSIYDMFCRVLSRKRSSVQG